MVLDDVDPVSVPVVGVQYGFVFVGQAPELLGPRRTGQGAQGCEFGSCPRRAFSIDRLAQRVGPR